jgi:hypothetical protein
MLSLKTLPAASFLVGGVVGCEVVEAVYCKSSYADKSDAGE